ncbi:MAG: UDP-glucose 4-epimerase GalE [Micromonosporaceae bacterium]|nr:UDP-glucose 4-epimerase GalE [Micromonosporaceae bacterium]
MKVLVTGGAGFIGSTVASACLDAGFEPVILDSLVTGREEFTEGRSFYRGDIADGRLLDRIFAEHPEIEATVHCAALIVVPESVTDPLRYWHANVSKTVSLVEHLLRNDRTRLLFSSTAALYGVDEQFAVDESSPIEPSSPYARTKAAVEAMLSDVAAATDLRALSLRYFNPIGADPLLRTGLQIKRPTHLLGKLIEAAETGAEFQVTGTDWPTRDGTGIRDYIHVWDLAAAHVASLRRFDDIVDKDGPGYQVLNLGTGTGTTVREMIEAFEEVTGRPVPRRETGPRPGDVAGAFTRSDRAPQVLGWRPQRDLAEGIRDSLRWAEVRDSRLR